MMDAIDLTRLSDEELDAHAFSLDREREALGLVILAVQRERDRRALLPKPVTISVEPIVSGESFGKV